MTTLLNSLPGTAPTGTCAVSLSEPTGTPGDVLSTLTIGGEVMTVVSGIGSADFIVDRGSPVLAHAVGATVTYTPGGGSGTVDSVNGQTGIVVLDSADILPADWQAAFEAADPALSGANPVATLANVGGGLTVEGDTGSVSGVTTLQVEGAGGASVAVTDPGGGRALATVTASGGGGGGGATYTAYTFTAADNDPGLGGGLLTTVPAGTLVLGMYGLVTESFDNSTTGLFLSVGDYANGDAMNYDPEIGPDPAPTNDGGNVTQWQFMPCSLPNTSGQIQVGRAGANPTGVWVACSGSGAPNNGSMDIILVTVP